MIWPVKAGFKDGLTGLRVSPSFDGLNESCGVNGKPECSVSIPLSCQSPNTVFHQRIIGGSVIAAERQIVSPVDHRGVADVERSPAVIPAAAGSVDWRTKAGEFVATLVFMLSPSSSAFEYV